MAKRLSEIIGEFSVEKDPKKLLNLSAQLFEELNEWVSRYELDDNVQTMAYVTLKLIGARLKEWREYANAHPDEIPKAENDTYEKIMGVYKELIQEHDSPGIVSRTVS